MESSEGHDATTLGSWPEPKSGVGHIAYWATEVCPFISITLLNVLVVRKDALALVQILGEKHRVSQHSVEPVIVMRQNLATGIFEKNT